MGQIYLVRHGQASLGADNYDQLSPLGTLQSARLGAYFKESAIFFEAAYVGTLVRQQHTLTELVRGLGVENLFITSQPALNEYDSAAVIKSVCEQDIPKASTREGYKAYFKLLRVGLLSWMQGKTKPVGMPSFKEFESNLINTLNHIETHHTGNVLVVSSGGPISTLISHLLDTSDSGRVELNLQLRNTCVSELQYTKNRARVISFNSLNHLSLPTYADWITYA